LDGYGTFKDLKLSQSLNGLLFCFVHTRYGHCCLYRVWIGIVWLPQYTYFFLIFGPTSSEVSDCLLLKSTIENEEFEEWRDVGECVGVDVCLGVCMSVVCRFWGSDSELSDFSWISVIFTGFCHNCVHKYQHSRVSKIIHDGFFWSVMRLKSLCLYLTSNQSASNRKLPRDLYFTHNSDYYCSTWISRPIF
jgi:hypothetical protein